MGRKASPLLAVLAGALVAVGPFAYALLTFPAFPNVNTPPAVTLGTPQDQVTEYAIPVSSAAPERRLADFRGRLLANGSPLADLLLDRADFDFGPLSFLDRDFDRRLSAGDVFHVQVVQPAVVELLVLWRDQEVARASWQVVVPAVGLILLSNTPQNATIGVADADPALNLSEYHASVLESGYFRTQLYPLMDGSSPDGMLTFVDADEGGTLTAGDRFIVRIGAYGQYELLLFWRQTQIASVSWWP